MASGVVLFDPLDRILIVKPTYKDAWLIPGGIVEENESPKEAAIRETEEEIGLVLPDVRLVCVHFTKPNPPRTESVQFVFSGGVLDEGEISRIRLQEDEIEDCRFATEAEAVPLLTVNLDYRLPFCIAAARNGTTAYLET